MLSHKDLMGEGGPSGWVQQDGAWIEEVKCPHPRGGGNAPGRVAQHLLEVLSPPWPRVDKATQWCQSKWNHLPP